MTAVIATAAYALHQLPVVSTFSPLILAIVIGGAIHNMAGTPAAGLGMSEMRSISAVHGGGREGQGFAKRRHESRREKRRYTVKTAQKSGLSATGVP